MTEKQTKTIMKYNLAPTRMAVVKKKKEKKITNVGEDVKKLEPFCPSGTGPASGRGAQGAPASSDDSRARQAVIGVPRDR